MAQPEIIKAEAHEVLDIAASRLADCPKDVKPLAILTDPNDGHVIAANEHLQNRMGVRFIVARQLTDSAKIQVGDSLDLFASLDSKFNLHHTTNKVKLYTQIYSFLKRSKLPNIMTMATMFRDILSEMEEVGPLELDEEKINNLQSGYTVEINFIVELWNQLIKDRLQQQRDNLKLFAQSIHGPVVYVHWGEANHLITEFISHVAKKNPATNCVALLDPEVQELDNLLNPHANELGEYQGIKPDLYHAESLEEAALAARNFLLTWIDNIQESTDRMGIIGYDLTLVKRIQSLLAQENIHINDTTGINASTLILGKALLALVIAPTKAEELLNDLLNVYSHHYNDKKWWEIIRLINQNQIYQVKEITQLENLLADFNPNNKISISEWFTKLAQATLKTPLVEFFSNDIAGINIRSLLNLLADEFSKTDDNYSVEISLNEFRKLLVDTLSTTKIVATETTNSSLFLLKPGTISTRKYRSLLLAGANRENLPATKSMGLVNNEVYSVLGLLTNEERIAKTRKSFAQTVSDCDDLAAVWYGKKSASPYLELMGAKVHTKITRPWERFADDEAIPKSHHAIMYKLPKRVGVTACSNLIACPYQFYARSVLNLEEDPPTGFGRRDLFGTFVHEILEKFHVALQKERNFDYKKKIRDLIDEALKLPYKPKHNFAGIAGQTKQERLLNAWEFEHYIEIYIKEIKNLYKEEYFVGIDQIEVNLEKKLTINDTEITIKGKADRVDRYHTTDGEDLYSIVDIKTGNPANYKDITENPQMPLYLALSDMDYDISNSAYWVLSISAGTAALTRQTAKDVGEEFPTNVIEDFTEIFTQANNKTKLPANGIKSKCRYCSYGGLCRKEHWAKI